MKRVLIAGIAAFAVAAAGTPTFAQPPLWQLLEHDGTPAGVPVVVRLDPANAAEAPWLVRSYGPTGAPPANGNGSAHGSEMNESELNSLGCIVGGTLATGAALYIGGLNVANLIAGGLVPAQTPGAFYVTLLGVVFATFCAVGQAMTPFAFYAYRNYIEPYGEQIRNGLPPVGLPPMAGGVHRGSLIRD